MSYANIRTQLKILIEEVPDMGKVHDYERLSVEWSKFLNLYKPDGENLVKGLAFTRIKAPERGGGEDGRATHKNRKLHHIKIRMYRSLNDAAASELTFQDGIDALCAKLRTNVTLNDTADICQEPQVDTIEPRFFGNVLCHYAEITLIAEEEIIV